MNGIPAISVTDLPDDAVLVDVREDDEWAAGHAPGARHIVMGELPGRIDELPSEGPVSVVCRSGGRSARVVQWLTVQGVDAVNVEGGMQAWAAAGKPLVGDAVRPYIA